jgi:hypothetical protein
MRVDIKILKKMDGWSVDVTAPSCAVPQRLLGSSRKEMPLPPLAEKAFWNSLDLGNLFDTSDNGTKLLDLHKSIIRGSVTAQSIAQYGDYLLATLLGPQWASIEKSAPANEPIELDLYIAPTDQVMQRLNWEVMLAGKDLLGRTVAITRVVASGSEDAAKGKITLPLRTLFVIGAPMDQSLRPGAEYVSLIRHLEAARLSPTAARSVDIEVELLVEATTEEIHAKVAEFRPSVVHVVAHGRWDGDNPQIILTKREETGGASVNEDACDAQRLLGSIRAIPDETGMLRPPPIVVLNACHTGEPNDAYLPYAARLAQDGVLVALGMAGEIADGACRIFTRAFYQALIDRQPVTVAVASARRAAMLHFQNFDRNVEWARPTIFLRDVAPRTIDVDRPRQILAAAAFRYRPRSSPEILCDRLMALNGYQSFRDRIRRRDYRSALAFEATDDKTTVQAPVGKEYQIGKSRILGEIAARAVFDGFLPCIIPSGSAFQPPGNMLRFAIRLAEVIDDSGANFAHPDGAPLVQRRRYSSALRFAAGVVKLPLDPFTPSSLVEFNLQKKAVTDAVESLRTASGVSPNDLRDVMGSDARALLNDVNKAVTDAVESLRAASGVSPNDLRDVMGSDARAVLKEVNTAMGSAAEGPFHSLLVLIDDLHGYEGIAVELLETVLEAGLAGDAKCAAVVFTYSTKSDRGGEIMNFIRDKRAIEKVPLGPFEDPWETRLSYAQMLLARPEPLAPTWHPDQRGYVDIFFEMLHAKVKGVPSFFDLAEDIIHASRKYKVLVDADDRAIIGSI